MGNCVELSWLQRVIDPPPPPLVGQEVDEKAARAKKLGNGRRLISLAKLVLQYTGYELNKGPERTSDWEILLSNDQQTCAYAFSTYFNNLTDCMHIT